jgi:hypothetical protein
VLASRYRSILIAHPSIQHQILCSYTAAAYRSFRTDKLPHDLLSREEIHAASHRAAAL